MSSPSHSLQRRLQPIAVPDLLSDFPTPPSFIPPSPTVSNPPPSLPPKSPLPPVPGPSPISTHDLNLISSVVSRSCRASRISLNSVNSRRDSYATSTAQSGGGSHVHSPSASTHTFGTPCSRSGSVTSLSQLSVRSHTSNVALSLSASHPRHHPPSPPLHTSQDGPIPERTDELTCDPDASLTHTSLADIPRFTPSPHPPVPLSPTQNYFQGADESIASVDMRDLPALHDDDHELSHVSEDGVLLQAKARALHLQIRASRSKSTMHKSHLSSRTSSPIGAAPLSGMSPIDQLPPSLRRRHKLPPPAPPPLLPPPPLPASQPVIRRRASSPVHRRSSPDIASMMASTPRPRRKSEGSSRSQSRARRQGESLPGSTRSSKAISVVSASLSYSGSHRPNSNMSRSERTTSYASEEWNEAYFVDGYGMHASDDSDGAANATMTAGTGDNDGDESDSSLDLHTPLPNLMLRHGMLSPHSKLLGHGQASRSATPFSAPADRPGSTFSLASTMTKSGIYKDVRDTAQRRVRHRDGKLLRGGIGLTTGLGWSDSEDEDAPSALTRRLSSLALSRKSSTHSIAIAHSSKKQTQESRPHSSDVSTFARSRSKSTSRSQGPPSSWYKSHTARSESANLDTSIRKSRLRSEEPPLVMSDLSNVDGIRTPSTVSTSSLQTPDALELTESIPRLNRPWDQEKSLPPLPRTLSRGPSLNSLNGKASVPNLRLSLKNSGSLSANTRTDSSSPSSTTSTARSLGRAPTTPVSAPPIPRKGSISSPRPLLMSSLSSSAIPPSTPAPIPSTGQSRTLPDSQRTRYVVAVTPTTPSLSRYGSLPGLGQAAANGASAKPKPRTGTGMVYRKSPSTSLPTSQSRMRLPSSVPPVTKYAGAVAI